MGTNYYLHTSALPDHQQIVHIGKHICGWCFLLHIIPERRLLDLDDWISFIEQQGTGAQIKSEYDEQITLQDLLEVITERRGPAPLKDSFENARSLDYFLESNHAIEGPNNLLRCRLGDNCRAHGSGTWDCILGEFS